MKKLILAFILILTLTGVNALAEEEAAVIVEVNGMVKVSIGGARYVDAEPNMKLSENDKLRTLLNSSVILRSFDGSLVDLGENTTIDLSTLKKDAMGNVNSKYKLWIGKLKANVSSLPTQDSKFEVETPTAVAGVRGTEFSVEVDQERKTKVRVNKGSVYFRTNEGDYAIVGANQTATTDDPNPTDVSDDEEEYSSEETEEIIPETATSGSSNLTLTLLTPSENYLTSRNEVRFQGTTLAGAVVSIENQTVTADNIGNFSLTVNLTTEGENSVNVTAKKDNDEVSITRTVVIDKTPPPLRLMNDLNIITNNSNLTISGTTEDGATVLINGVPVRFSGTTFSRTLTLVEGQNTITVTASDEAGNQTDQVVSVLLDTISPVLTLTKYEVLSNGNLFIEGYTEAGAEVLVNDYPITVRSNGTFSQEVKWTTGHTEFEIVAKDQAGNVTRTKQSITGSVDSEAPKYISFNFSPTSVEPGQTVSVTVQASDNIKLSSTAKQLLNLASGAQTELTLNLSGSYYLGSYTLPLNSQAGNYTFTTLTLSDEAGNILQTDINRSFSVEKTPPQPPANLSIYVEPAGGKLRLSFTASVSADVLSYNIYRSNTTGGPYVLVGTTSTTSYTDANLINGTRYYYVVRAVDNLNQLSSYSAETNGTPKDTLPPSAPSLSANAMEGQIELTWTKPPESDVAGYKVYLSNSTGSSVNLIHTIYNAGTLSYTDSGVGKGTYYYVVRAFDNAPVPNESGNSNVASATIN